MVGMLGFLVMNVSHGNIHHPALTGDLLCLRREEARVQVRGQVGVPALLGGSGGWGHAEAAPCWSQHTPGRLPWLPRIFRWGSALEGQMKDNRRSAAYNEPISFLMDPRCDKHHSERGARRPGSTPDVTTMEWLCDCRCGPWYPMPTMGLWYHPPLKDS